MSDTMTQPSPASSATPGSDQAAAGAGDAAGTPAGFVPLAEAEKAREDGRKAEQSARDLRTELDRLKAASAAAPASVAPKDDSGSDLDAFKKSLLQEVYGANLMSQASIALKSEFPDADPTLFSPEKLSQFGSPEAFRFAVEDSHKRVAAILAERSAAIEAKVREEMAAKFGDGGAGPAGSTPAPGADPTPAQLAAMSVSEMNALEAASPGVMDRVLKAASA